MKFEDKVKEILEEKSDYDEFFKKKLEKYGVKSPEDLSDEDKKKFFGEIDKEWKADKESD